MSFDNQQPWKRIHQQLGVEEIPFNGLGLSNRFVQKASKMPEQAALAFYGHTISLGQLEEISNRFANQLLAEGLGKGSVIGAQMPNIPQYAVVFLAASKIGAIVSSISPLYTPPETAYQIDNSKIEVVVALDAFAQPLAAAYESASQTPSLTILCSASEMLDNKPTEVVNPALGKQIAFTNFVNQGDTTAIDTPCDADATFLLQYTGGTTGRPKGAMLTQKGLMAVIDNSYAYTPYLERDEVFCPFPFFHIAGTSALMSALCIGASYSILPNPRDIDQLCGHLVQFTPSVMAAVPTLYEALLSHPKFSEIDFSQVRMAGSGAAPLSGETRKRLEAVIGSNKITDLFGMTETSPTYCSNPPTCGKPDSIGIPMPGADVRIVDVETGNTELPFGESGEIIAHTPGIMKGYLNLPEETAKALRQFKGRTYMYTGDVGFMNEAGFVHVCDRAKDMLIVGGFKVFSVEVEDKLASLDEVVLSAVVATPDTARPGNDIVNLFVQLSESHQGGDEDGLRENIIRYCRENMAPYKVPKNIYFIEQIPVTAVGKLDKKQLRDKALQLIEVG